PPPPPPAPDDPPRPPPLYTFDQYPPSANDNVVLQWDEELLQAFRALPPGPTQVARAIHVLHTAIFDAWSAYDPKQRVPGAGVGHPGRHGGAGDSETALRLLLSGLAAAAPSPRRTSPRLGG